jgi:Protein of unknown function (DUF1499)
MTSNPLFVWTAYALYGLLLNQALQGVSYFCGMQLKELKPDKFTPKLVTKTDDYVYVEYESPTFGFIDDVEFYFPDVCAHLCAANLFCLAAKTKRNRWGLYKWWNMRFNSKLRVKPY